MPDLSFQVEQAAVLPFAAAPSLVFKVRLANAAADEAIHSVALRCQLQIEATRRRYSAPEQEWLLEVFGEPERWSQTLRSLVWSHLNVIVPSFTGSTVTELVVPCTFDFNVAATKYFHALQDGEIPLRLLFSGTVFYAAADGALQVAQISWEREAAYRLPVRVWQEMMALYYPNSAWVRVRQDLFDRLSWYKAQRGLPTWEQVFESLLIGAEETTPR